MADQKKTDGDTPESVAASKTSVFDENGSPVHEGQPGWERAKAIAALDAKLASS